jgi:endonuclease/exonuclease/phosphatase family metal-dependent hydrolase
MKGISGLLCLFVLSGPAAAPEPPPRAVGSGLSIVSLNLAKEKNPNKILRELARAVSVRDADLFLFQEAVHSNGAANGVAGELAQALKMHVVFAPAAPGVYNQGLAVLSRYPIRDTSVCALKRCNLRFRSRTRFALGVTVDAPEGPVRVWNVHLDTRINAQERLEQLAPVLNEAAALSGPKIIGGDFNTNDFRWVANIVPIPWVRSQTGAVRQFMGTYGFTAQYQPRRPTFDYLGMQLDWIYHHGLQATSATIHPMGFSDHHALSIRFVPGEAAHSAAPRTHSVVELP